LGLTRSGGGRPGGGGGGRKFKRAQCQPIYSTIICTDRQYASGSTQLPFAKRGARSWMHGCLLMLACTCKIMVAPFLAISASHRITPQIAPTPAPDSRNFARTPAISAQSAITALAHVHGVGTRVLRVVFARVAHSACTNDELISWS
jgi:hypothetical protein